MKKTTIMKLNVDNQLLNFINDEVIQGLDLDINKFWEGFSNSVHNLTPLNNKLLKKRIEIQKKIDDWHRSNKDKKIDKSEYIKFLK